VAAKGAGVEPVGFTMPLQPLIVNGYGFLVIISSLGLAVERFSLQLEERREGLSLY
jgi:hypothetical protein